MISCKQSCTEKWSHGTFSSTRAGPPGTTTSHRSARIPTCATATPARRRTPVARSCPRPVLRAGAHLPDDQLAACLRVPVEKIADRRAELAAEQNRAGSGRLCAELDPAPGRHVAQSLACTRAAAGARFAGPVPPLRALACSTAPRFAGGVAPDPQRRSRPPPPAPPTQLAKSGGSAPPAARNGKGPPPQLPSCHRQGAARGARIAPPWRGVPPARRRAVKAGSR